MKQYRYTSQHFVPEGETGDADAFMDPTELNELRKLAGMPPLAEDMSTNGAGLVGGNIDNVPQAQEGGRTSPVGTNITNTAQHRNELLQKYKARPGDELWFLINFEPVRGLGAESGTLEQKIQDYLNKHPEKRPENLPQLPNAN